MIEGNQNLKVGWVRFLGIYIRVQPGFFCSIRDGALKDRMSMSKTGPSYLDLCRFYYASSIIPISETDLRISNSSQHQQRSAGH